MPSRCAVSPQLPAHARLPVARRGRAYFGLSRGCFEEGDSRFAREPADLSVNREVVEADYRVSVALDGSVIQCALRTMHQLCDVDLGHGKVRHGRIAGTQPNFPRDGLVFGRVIELALQARN